MSRKDNFQMKNPPYDVRDGQLAAARAKLASIDSLADAAMTINEAAADTVAMTDAQDVVIHGDVPSWTREEIERAELGDVVTAAEFGTEFMQALDINRYDYELDGCLLPAFSIYVETAESGTCTPEGSFLLAMRAIAHNLPISYGRGPVPDPRPSEVILKEIEGRSHYISTLRDELEFSLSEEAKEKVKTAFGRARDGGLESDGSIDDAG
jgi:hypothetical protein